MEHDGSCDGWDHLSFEAITQAWSKVSGHKPETLMEALVAAFWRGEFETSGKSVVFLSFPPRPPSRWANYGGREPTPQAERRSLISREDTARAFYVPSGQRRGIVPGEPADFELCHFGWRNSAYPNWRVEYEERFRALSTIPIEHWPTDGPLSVREYCAAWLIRRHDFGGWYGSSPLSAGAALATFWPSPDLPERASILTTENLRVLAKAVAHEIHAGDMMAGLARNHVETADGARLAGATGAAAKADNGRAERKRVRASDLNRVRGPRPEKLARAIEAMKKEDPRVLHQMKEKQLVARWGCIAQRTWLREARKIVLSPERRQIVTNDK